MPTASDCVFCKIVQGQLPAAKVLETSSSVAFLDIQPLAEGHVLLLPKEHYATVMDISPAALGELTAELPRLSRAILRAVEAPSLSITVNNGPAAGQVVPHLHFHLIPRDENDGVLSYAPGVSRSDAERESLRDRIVAALAG